MIIVDLLIIISVCNDEYNSWLKGIQQFEYKVFKFLQLTIVFIILYENDN